MVKLLKVWKKFWFAPTVDIHIGRVCCARHYADGQPVCDRIRKTPTSPPRYSHQLTTERDTSIRTNSLEEDRATRYRDHSVSWYRPSDMLGGERHNFGVKNYITLRILLSIVVATQILLTRCLPLLDTCIQVGEEKQCVSIKLGHTRWIMR